MDRGYFQVFRDQIPVLGLPAHAALRSVRIWVSGTGRIGSAVVLQSAAVGVGTVLMNDPQVLELTDLGAHFYARRSDLGRPKVDVLRRFLSGRPNLAIEAAVCPTESDRVAAYAHDADLIVSCANTIAGRLAAERRAVQFQKPIMQVAADDGRARLQGLITLRLPKRTSSACFGCYLPDRSVFPRGEGLLSSTTSALAAVAVNMAVQIVTGVRSSFVTRRNYFAIDLEEYTIQALWVSRRPDCRICGARREHGDVELQHRKQGRSAPLRSPGE
jgi:molybdopterin/thiamine biosynthesis adenylyltransferase